MGEFVGWYGEYPWTAINDPKTSTIEPILYEPLKPPKVQNKPNNLQHTITVTVFKYQCPDLRGG